MTPHRAFQWAVLTAGVCLTLGASVADRVVDLVLDRQPTAARQESAARPDGMLDACDGEDLIFGGPC